MAFEIIESLSRADVAFRVRGKDLEGLFIAGARALVSIMLQNIEEVRPAIARVFDCEAADLDLLFYDFLQEFIYYKDTEKLILLPDSVEFIESPERCRLSCKARGERIDRGRHHFTVDIKAVTMHNLKVVKDNDTWTATAVVDV
jgi:protein archease